MGYFPPSYFLDPFTEPRNAAVTLIVKATSNQAKRLYPSNPSPENKGNLEI